MYMHTRVDTSMKYAYEKYGIVYKFKTIVKELFYKAKRA